MGSSVLYRINTLNFNGLPVATINLGTPDPIVILLNIEIGQ